MRGGDIISGWGKILRGKMPLLSIEITSECPLSCPGCYAYGDRHLGGGVTLTQLSDSRGETLVQGILRLVDQHDPMQLSLVGGEPMMRHRELSRLLPILSARGIYTMVVTSGVIPIPAEWTSLPRVTIAISVDGLPEHHDVRRKPAISCNGTSAPVSIPTTGSYTFVVHDGDYGNSRQTGSYNANWQFNEGCPTCILSPPSLGFGLQLVGTISAPKIATLTNTGLVESLTITNIATNANFRETNNCGGVVAPAVLARST